MCPSMAVFEALPKPVEIDASVRSRLADSLSHIFSRARDHLDCQPAQLEMALEQIRQNRQDPGIFARYFDLVLAIRSNRFEHADELFGEIIEIAGQPVEFSIIPYSRDALGADYERFPRLLFSEYDGANPMAEPTNADFLSNRRQLEDAMDIINRVDKSLHDEITNLTLRVCVSCRGENKSAGSFGSVTSLMVWGASFINIDTYKKRWESVQFFVHEITHSLLFGLSCDYPLVLNAPHETYESPLRVEPRPMDGIFHAVIVCARMVAFNRAGLDQGLVEKNERFAVEQMTDDVLKKFKDGVEVVRRHGKLSDMGHDLVDQGCRALSVSS